MHPLMQAMYHIAAVRRNQACLGFFIYVKYACCNAGSRGSLRHCARSGMQ